MISRYDLLANYGTMTTTEPQVTTVSTDQEISQAFHIPGGGLGSGSEFNGFGAHLAQHQRGQGYSMGATFPILRALLFYSGSG